MWIHEDQDWPNVTWDAETYASKLADIRHPPTVPSIQSLARSLRERWGMASCLI